jgi:hypothetical protein
VRQWIGASRGALLRHAPVGDVLVLAVDRDGEAGGGDSMERGEQLAVRDARKADRVRSISSSPPSLRIVP